MENVHSGTAEAIKSFYQNWNLDEAETNQVISEHFEELCAASNLVFYVDGDFAQDDPEIKAAWEEFYCQKEKRKKRNLPGYRRTDRDCKNPWTDQREFQAHNPAALL